MRIRGAGGCFENRLYEIDIEVAWNLALLCVNEMGVIIDDTDVSNHLIHFHSKKKIMQVAVQQIDSETVQVIMDATKKRFEVYSWKPQTKEVNLFFDLFDKKVKEYKLFIICPNCSSKISYLAKFCPECGYKIK